MCFRKKITPMYFVKNIGAVIGLVLIWRGVWYVFDAFDYFVMKGEHIYSAVGGILIGLAILYFPDKNLKQIEKL